MTFDPYKLIKYHLYLLQLENYELGRFWKLLLAKGWFPPSEQRKNLVWTVKARVLFGVSELLILICGIIYYQRHLSVPFMFVWQRFLGFLVIIYLLDFVTPVFLTLSTIILWPLDFVVKKVLVARAKFKIQNLKFTIIAIAGSYGKTTMKEVIGSVLSAKYKVESTPESVNTPVGIARWILNKVDGAADVLVVEMGEHYRGDVAEICGIVKPDISVITGINEAHMERMNSLKNITATIFEAVSSAKPKSLIVINGDDKNVTAYYKEYIGADQRVEKFQISNFKTHKFDTEKLCWEVEDVEIGKLEIKLLGEYGLGDVDGAIKIAKHLGLSFEQIKQGVAKVKAVEHRLQPIRSAGDILVIDDSYNGNPAGVTEAVKVLSQFANRRKVYITPGLVEMGKASEQVHREIGKQLLNVADVVILIKNSVTPWIAAELTSLSVDQLVSFATAQEAHAALPKILKPGDVILFQNDWGDNYT